jgi:hypothetical protein
MNRYFRVAVLIVFLFTAFWLISREVNKKSIANNTMQVQSDLAQDSSNASIKIQSNLPSEKDAVNSIQENVTTKHASTSPKKNKRKRSSSSKTSTVVIPSAQQVPLSSSSEEDSFETTKTEEDACETVSTPNPILENSTLINIKIANNDTSLSRDDAYKTGEKLFEEHEFNLAKDIFSKLNKFKEAEIKSAKCSYELKDYTLALSKLESIKTNTAMEEAERIWLISNCYTKQNDNKSAVEYLKILVKSTNQYTKQADELLRQIQ